jgi:hypothetical protein
MSSIQGGLDVNAGCARERVSFIYGSNLLLQIRFWTSHILAVYFILFYFILYICIFEHEISS